MNALMSAFVTCSWPCTHPRHEWLTKNNEEMKKGWRKPDLLQDDEGLGNLAGLDVRNADHGRISDGGVREEGRLEFGRCHLQTLELDQLLDPAQAYSKPPL